MENVAAGLGFQLMKAIGWKQKALSKQQQQQH